MSYLGNGDRDSPENRGYGWETRAEEIKDRDNYECQSCGIDDEVLGVHHIIKGRHLPMGNARVWANLVTLCSGCHSELEGLPPRLQFRRLAQYDGHMSSYRSEIADVIQYLQTGWCRKKEIRKTLGISKKRADGILSNLVPMGSAIKGDDSRYRAPIAEVCRAERVHVERRIETLEKQLERERSLREEREGRIKELEAEAEENNRQAKNAIANLETAVMELRADRPVLRQARSDVKEAKSLIENTQESDEPEKTREKRLAEAMEELS